MFNEYMFSNCDSQVQVTQSDNYKKPNADNPNLRCVSDLPQQYHHIFSEFQCFNSIQSQLLDELLLNDEPIVVSAPTGSGKTALFELAIIRLLEANQYQQSHMLNQKIVYMAPVKALCTEKYNDWERKFQHLGLKAIEVTGDSDEGNLLAIQHFNLVLTTPEKWDSLTRKWRDHASLVSVVKLFLIDEVHLLNEEKRGSTLEAVISRMKTVQESSSCSSDIRFIAVSATIPNIEDVAVWLGKKTKPAKYFRFGEETRPVRLKKIVKTFPFSNPVSHFKFDLYLSYKLRQVILDHSDGKPTLIFCSTRKSVLQTCNTLLQNITFHFTPVQKMTLEEAREIIQDPKLRDMVRYGVGFHHAGLIASDRHTMEELFRSGFLPVLICTSTLAMGVNLPAHLVIIKSTSQYVNGCWEEYSEGQVLQMMGRAGRPQFDSHATAVILTKHSLKEKYEKLVIGNQTVESNLHKNLAEHLNSEIVLGTITDVAVAVHWLRSTFLYVRALKNPSHYGIPSGLSTSQLETRLQAMCMRELNGLEKYKLIEKTDFAYNVEPTENGKLMARLYIAFETMKTFMKVKGTENLPELLELLSLCHEFQDVQLRVNERTTLNLLNNDKHKETIRFPLQGRIKSRDMKVNCLLQAVLGALHINDPSLSQEANRVIRIAERIAKALSLYLWQKNHYQALASSLILSKCLSARLWENSIYLSRHLPGIGPTLASLLAAANKTTFQSIINSNPRDLERILNKHPPVGNSLQEAARSIPQYSLNLTYGEFVKKLHVTINLLNAEKVHDIRRTSSLLIADSNNLILWKEKISDGNLIEHKGEYMISVNILPNVSYVISHLISDTLVGVDVRKEISLRPLEYANSSIDSRAYNFTDTDEDYLNDYSSVYDVKETKYSKINETSTKRKALNKSSCKPQKRNKLNQGDKFQTNLHQYAFKPLKKFKHDQRREIDRSETDQETEVSSTQDNVNLNSKPESQNHKGITENQKNKYVNSPQIRHNEEIKENYTHHYSKIPSSYVDRYSQKKSISAHSHQSSQSFKRQDEVLSKDEKCFTAESHNNQTTEGTYEYASKVKNDYSSRSLKSFTQPFEKCIDSNENCQNLIDNKNKQEQNICSSRLKVRFDSEEHMESNVRTNQSSKNNLSSSIAKSDISSSGAKILDNEESLQGTTKKHSKFEIKSARFIFVPDTKSNDALSQGKYREPLKSSPIHFLCDKETHYSQYLKDRVKDTSQSIPLFTPLDKTKDDCELFQRHSDRELTIPTTDISYDYTKNIGDICDGISTEGHLSNTSETLHYQQIESIEHFIDISKSDKGNSPVPDRGDICDGISTKGHLSNTSESLHYQQIESIEHVIDDSKSDKEDSPVPERGDIGHGISTVRNLSNTPETLHYQQIESIKHVIDVSKSNNENSPVPENGNPVNESALNDEETKTFDKSTDDDDNEKNIVNTSYDSWLNEGSESVFDVEGISLTKSGIQGINKDSIQNQNNESISELDDLFVDSSSDSLKSAKNMNSCHSQSRTHNVCKGVFKSITSPMVNEEEEKHVFKESSCTSFSDNPKTSKSVCIDENYYSNTSSYEHYTYDDCDQPECSDAALSSSGFSEKSFHTQNPISKSSQKLRNEYGDPFAPSLDPLSVKSILKKADYETKAKKPSFNNLFTDRTKESVPSEYFMPPLTEANSFYHSQDNCRITSSFKFGSEFQRNNFNQSNTKATHKNLYFPVQKFKTAGPKHHGNIFTQQCSSENSHNTFNDSSNKFHHSKGNIFTQQCSSENSHNTFNDSSNKFHHSKGNIFTQQCNSENSHNNTFSDSSNKFHRSKMDQIRNKKREEYGEEISEPHYTFGGPLDKNIELYKKSMSQGSLFTPVKNKTLRKLKPVTSDYLNSPYPRLANLVYQGGNYVAYSDFVPQSSPSCSSMATAFRASSPKPVFRAPSYPNQIQVNQTQVINPQTPFRFLSEPVIRPIPILPQQHEYYHLPEYQYEDVRNSQNYNPYIVTLENGAPVNFGSSSSNSQIMVFPKADLSSSQVFKPILVPSDNESPQSFHLAMNDEDSLDEDSFEEEILNKSKVISRADDLSPSPPLSGEYFMKALGHEGMNTMEPESSTRFTFS